MKADAEAQKAERLAGIAAAQEQAKSAGSESGGGAGDVPAYQGGNIDSVGTVGKVKSIDGDVNLSDEDIKLYRDLAERRYMNNVELQTLAPNITINVPQGRRR